MSKQGNSRKPLIIGIIAAVVILAAVLALLLTQCVGGGSGATESTPVPTTEEQIPTYDLYWNLDRAEYDGKSEAGMSSRQQESDGYFHIRFFKDGETIELRAADRKIINAVDVNDLMGLEFDENGIIIGVISLDDMPVEQVGWQFYVQSIGGKVLKLNSSKAYNGLEVVLDIEKDTGIYDMTGLEGEVGMSITPMNGDRVIALADLGGKLTHVFVYDRPEFMQTFEAECEHCKKTVEWKMWNKENSLPTTDGHYQLQNDISGMSAQQAIKEDQKVCLDLNGKIVDGKQNARVYTLHNPNCELAIMDTSEGKTGTLRGHSTSSDQGGVVWVRYGAFYLYSGILDASDMVSKLNGTAVDVAVNTKDGVKMISYFYMYGGEIIGGTAKWQRNDKGNYTNGLGGALSVRGKFVMYGGVIRDGKALGVVTAKNADGTPKTYQRGFGGNIYVQSGGEVEIHGGTIKNGTATHSGGNIYIDGTGTVLLNGGVIEGGRVTGKGRNGGNVFVTSKATFTLKSGRVSDGRSYNCAANLYLNGKVVMTGGYIGRGKILTWGTNKVNPTADTANVFSVQGDFYMYGGHVEGSFTCTDTVAGKDPTIIYLTTHAKIYGDEDAQCNDLVLNVGGDNIDCRVGNLRDTSKIGIYTTSGIFSNPTSESNLDSFFSNVDDAEVHYVDGCLALGRKGGCECGVNSENAADHLGACTGEQLFWAPLATTTMPTTTGNYYMPRVKDENGNLVPRTLTAKAQSSMVENAAMHIDLNGGTLNGPENYRLFSMHNPGAKLTICDSSEAKTGTIKTKGVGTSQGNAVWVRYGEFTLYSGTLDGSGYTLQRSWDKGTDGVFGTKDDSTGARDGGTVAMATGTTFNMYGGAIIGNFSTYTTLTKTVKETVEVDGKEETVSKEYTRSMDTCNGMSLNIGKNSVFNMYGGVIRDGITEGGYGGNIYVSSTGTANLYAGTITGGRAKPTYKEDGKTVNKKGWGANICVTDSAVLNILGEDVLITGGVSGGNGGNVYSGNVKTTINMKAGLISGGQSTLDQGGNMFISGTATLSGGKLVDGKAANGGNLGINSGKEVLLSGIEITGGDVGKGAGGNVRMSTTNKTGMLTIAEGTVITGGKAGNGGNIAIQTNNANKTDPIATVVITGGTIENGVATTYGGNLYLSGGTTEFATISGGEILNGQSGTEGGNIYVNANTTLDLKGGLISGGKSVTGGNIMIPSDSSKTVINMSGDAVVTDGVADKNGGNIRVSTGTFNMTGGTISNGVSTGDHGGNLWLAGTVNLTGGNLLDGKANSGGNITVNGASAVLNLANVTISGGTAKNDGGNIKIFHSGIKEFNIGEGTVIADGTATTGGNIYLAVRSADYNDDKTVKKSYSVKATMTGGTIADGTATGNGGNIYMTCGTDSSLEFTMTGGAIIGGNASGTGGNIMMDTGSVMNLSEGAIENGTSTGSAGSIYLNTKAVLTMTGGIITGGTATAADGGNLYVAKNAVATITGGQILDGTSLRPAAVGGNGGNIRINGGTVTLENATVSGGKAGMLAADGETIDYGAPYPNTKGWGGNINVGAGTLNIGEGTIVSDGTCGGNGGNIYCNGTLNITGGSVCRGESKFDNGGNIWMGAKTTLNVSGGEIIGGVASNKGGNIHANADANISITGGYITDGSSGKGNMTAVHANINFEKSQTITFGSVTINGYVNIASGSAVKLTGKPVINGAEAGKTNLTLNGNKLDVSELDVGTDTNKIGISTNAGNGIFSGLAEESDKAYFFADDSEYRTVAFDAINKCLTLGKFYCLCGQTDAAAEHKLGCDKDVKRVWIAATSKTSLPTISGNYYLAPGLTVDLGSQWKPAADSVIALDLNGRTVTCKSRVFAFNNANVNITLTDTAGGGKVWKDGTLYFTEGTNDTPTDGSEPVEMYKGQGAIVWVNAGSTFNMIDGIIDGTGYVNTHSGAAVCVQGENSTFNMYNGTIKGAASTGYGGNVAVYGTNTAFNMYGGIITGGKAVKGGNIAIQGSGAVTITGESQIEKGESSGNGGNIWIDGANASLEISGKVTVSNGVTTGDNGGNIFNGGTLKVTGGEIKDGRASKGGGNIAMNSTQSIELNDVTISGGHADIWEAGNIEIWSSAPKHISFNNVKILDGTTDRDDYSAANLYIGNLATTVNITNTEIDGYARIAGAKPTVNLSGKVTITGAAEGDTNLRLDGTKLTLKDLQEDSLIGITAGGKGGIFSTPAEENKEYVDNFRSDDPTLTVGYEDGMLVLVLGRERCLCGSTTETHDLGCDGTKHFWAVWTDRESLPTESGYYYLSGDVTLREQQIVALADQKIILDLNGKTVKNAEGSNIRMYALNASAADLTITDTVGGGKMVNTSTYTQGGIIWVNCADKKDDAGNVTSVAAKATLIKGTLDASGYVATGADAYYSSGSAISLASAGCTFTMYGGELLGGKSYYGGGAIFGENWDSRINILGGTITGHAEETHAAIRLYGTKNVIANATVTGGVEINSQRFDKDTSKSANQLTLKGNANIDSLLITDSKEKEAVFGNYLVLPLITVEGTLTNTTPIKVSVLNNVEHIFTIKATDEANGSKFEPATAGQSVVWIEEDGKLYIGATRCLCGTTHDASKGYTDPETGKFVGCDGTPKPFMAWTSTTGLPTTSGYYYLTADVDFAGQSSIGKNQKVYLDLNGMTVKPAQTDGKDVSARCYSIHNPGAMLTLADSVGTGSITSSSTKTTGAQGVAIWVRRDSSWNADNNIGTFVLLGGTIIGNTPNTSTGGAVQVDNYGSFYMLGGTISGGTTSNKSGGGNVYLNPYSKMVMVDGTITGGTNTNAEGVGGNITVKANATFTMLGGKIEKGTATNGANICVEGNATISGGTIEAGTATNGGNIYTVGTVTMNAGKITDGKVYIANGGTFTMNGGEIADGNTTANGGNVYVAAGGTFTVNDGTVSDGTAVNGGNVYAEATTTDDNGTTDDTTDDVTIPGGSVIMNGGSISGGTATGGHGGNLYLDTGTTANITGTSVIEDGKAIRTNIRFTDDKETALTGTNGTGGNIFSKGSLTIGGTNVQIKNGKAGALDGSGNVIYTVSLEGKDGTKTAKVGWGGNIELQAGTLTLKDGATVSGGHSGGNGGNIRIAGTSTMNMTGGEVTEGTTLDNGGNIFVNTTLTTSGGEITGGNATNGGNISINTSKTVTLNGMTITGGNATSQGGNVRLFNNAAATLKIGAGTEISGGTTPAAKAATANLDVTVGATVELNGCEIAGYANIPSGAKVTVSGATKITGGTTNLTYTGLLNIGTMTSGAKIGVSRNIGFLSNNTVDAAYEDYFVSDKAENGVVYIAEGTDKGKLYVGPVYAECGKTSEHDAHDFCDGQLHTWAPIDVLPSLAGHYYLTDTLTITASTQTKTITKTADIALDLNGKNIVSQIASTSGAAGRLYSTRYTTDYTVPVSILFTNTSSEAAAIKVDDNAVAVDNIGDQGRVVWLVGANKRVDVYNVDFDMSGVEIRNDKTQNGLIFATSEVDKGTAAQKNHINIYNSNITGGNAKGGLINADGNTDVLLHDVTITGHTGSDYVGGIRVYSKAGFPAKLTLSGETRVYNNKIYGGTSSANITIGDYTTLELADSYVGSTTAPQGIDAPVDTVILAEVGGEWFAADSADKKVVYMEDGMKLVAADATIYCVCGSTTAVHAKGCDGTDYQWIALTNIADLQTPGNYYLTADTSASAQLTAKEGNLRLDLNGWTITDGSNRFMTTNGSKNAKITVTDTSAEKDGAIVVDHSERASAYDGQGVGFWLTGSGCELNWVRGKLDVSTVTTIKYGGVAIYATNGTTVNMYDGTILGGTSTRDSKTGGNIACAGSVRILAGATMNMYGGTITGGKTLGANGGNVHVAGTFVMHNGTISNGTTSQAVVDETTYEGYAGNICIEGDNAEFKMLGGTVSGGNSNNTNDKAANHGGNIFLYNGAFNMEGGLVTGGKIKGNASNMSANVSIYGGMTMNMSGGQIDGRVTGSGSGKKTLNFSGSAKILTPTAANPVANNNVSLAVTVNIGKVNEDARIGFQCSAVSGTTNQSEDLLAGTEKFLANVLDPDSYKVSMSGLSVYIASDKYNRTYELFIRDGKLYARQASATLKNP